MQKRAAVINDYASFGRCSLAVTIPILSVMKVQCCGVPTSLFTNHTGYPSFSWKDLSAFLPSYIEEWKKLDLHFDAIQTGFLGSPGQVDFLMNFIAAFRKKGVIVAVDPVMGDYGRLYSTYDRKLAERMRRLLDVADILTPNLTEACVLASREYNHDISDADLAAMARHLSSRNNAKVVITGLERAGALMNFAYEPGRKPFVHCERKIGEDRSGTGDVFSSVILADAVNGVDFFDSVAKASRFVASAVKRSVELGTPLKDGLAIEEVLSELIERQPKRL